MTFEQQPLAGRYSLIRQLAAGSYAETWLGNDGALDRYVAIKLLHSTDSNPDEDTQEFLHEARIAAAVSHPNIVAVYDAGEEDGRPFLIMEWVDGETLKQEIISSRRITPERALDVSSELLDGLSVIHAQGIIHRDVKPQNIMVNGFGTVKLTDFGIARLITEPESRTDGTTAGSAAYMAPEQAQGLAVTPAADIYAAGVILYEMLTGRLPFRSDDPQEVLLQHINEPVPRPRRTNPSIPAQVEAIVLKALEKNPEDRFTSADEMRDALLIARTHLPVRRPVTLPAYEESGFGVSLPRMAWMAASIALIVVAIAGATSLAVLDFGTSQTSAGSDDQTIVSEDTPSTPESTPEPVVTSESATTAQESQTGPPDPPYSMYENEFRVRGEVVIEGPSAPQGSVNRPAPSRPATEEEMADDGADEQVTAQVQQPAPPPPPPPTPTPPPAPTPTPVPVEEPEPTATPEPVEEDPQDSENPAEPGEAPGQGSDSSNGDQNSDPGNGNNGGNNQGQNGDGDAPASHQEQVDEDESADPQSSDDDEPGTEPDATDNMVATDDSAANEDTLLEEDDDIADLSESEANSDDDDEDAAAGEEEATASNASTSISSNDDRDDVIEIDDSDAELIEADAAESDDDARSPDDDDEAKPDDEGATENDDSDAELLEVDSSESDNDARSSDEDEDEKSRDQDPDESDKDGDESRDKKKDTDKKKTRDQPRTERIFDRFINRFSPETAA